jgi:hypothetical protein
MNFSNKLKYGFDLELKPIRRPVLISLIIAVGTFFFAITAISFFMMIVSAQYYTNLEVYVAVPIAIILMIVIGLEAIFCLLFTVRATVYFAKMSSEEYNAWDERRIEIAKAARLKATEIATP